jgi:DNA-binding PadR family transcriptional regulator
MSLPFEEEKTAANWLKETQKGYIRIGVLILLSKKPHHGYEIMKAVRERTMGFWRPTPGGIYPVLRDLEESGYIEGEWDAQKKRKRKIYTITATGKNILKRALAKQSQLANNMNDLFKDYIKEVLNVEAASIQAPRVPNIFSMFLEERRRKPEDTINILRHKHAQLEDMIDILQTELREINKKLVQLEQPKVKNTQKIDKN